MNCDIFPASVIQYCQQMNALTESSVFQDYGVLGLFINALLSATALPIPTEILTTALLNGGESQILVILALSGGASIGGVLNYALGFGGNKLFNRLLGHKLIKIHPPEEPKKDRLGRLGRLGWFGIFFAPFIPAVGDIILISAGAKRMEFRKYLVIMISGKIFKAVTVVLGISFLT